MKGSTSGFKLTSIDFSKINNCTYGEGDLVDCTTTQW